MKFPISIVLFLLFLTLKLTEVIDWSWWWVSSPIWIPIAILAFVFGLTGVISSIYNGSDK